MRKTSRTYTPEEATYLIKCGLHAYGIPVDEDYCIDGASFTIVRWYLDGDLPTMTEMKRVENLLRHQRDVIRIYWAEVAPSQTVIEEAVEIYHNSGVVDDDWFSIGPHWDLNLFASDGKIKGILHPVVNGQTNTSWGHNIS